MASPVWTNIPKGLEMLFTTLLENSKLHGWQIYDEHNRFVTLKIRFTQDQHIIETPQTFRKVSQKQAKRNQTRVTMHKQTVGVTTRSMVPNTERPRSDISEPERLSCLNESPAIVESTPVHDTDHNSDLIHTSMVTPSPPDVALGLTETPPEGMECEVEPEPPVMELVPEIPLTNESTDDEIISVTHSDTTCDIECTPEFESQCGNKFCCFSSTERLQIVPNFDENMYICEKCICMKCGGKLLLCEICYADNHHVEHRKYLKLKSLSQILLEDNK